MEKVLHLSQTDIRYDNRILKEMSALAKSRKYDVFGIGAANNEAKHHSRQIQIFRITTLNILSTKLSWLPRPIRYICLLIELTVHLTWKGCRYRPAIVHSHDTMALPAGALIKMLTGAKLIYDAHELESDKNGQSPVLSKATIYIERLLWRTVDHLISVSPSILEWYDDNLGKKPHTLILNSPFIEGGVETKDYARRYFHEKFKISQDHLVFVYLGLLGNGRGIETVLSAFTQNEIGSHVVFVGYGELKNKISSIAASVTNIHLHDPVPHEKVVELVKSADVGLCLMENVSLSDYYCLPNKLFEYAFAGVPVLASRFPDIERLVAQYDLGFCCDNDKASIACKVKAIEQSKLFRVTTDLTPLSWNIQASRLVKVYQNILEGI